ncbi:MFS transporter [Acidianus sulfidivorans JP7]|uniref:Digeranylgeranylglyceryl phosphate synthase n=1 Tax=Acidianus sulfidivorans JP7 TaxID=619593 RepID=A0A2U9INK8_9CREN|nr:UbiA family prenyltransferase [Acidianus sulfidivorans]AWR97595.1 MFS transporter [Acidianus sulfidivorans JP7]
MSSYLKLVRIHNVVGAALGDFTGYVVASGWKFDLKPFILSLLIVALIAAGGYAINDVYDINIDKINKPDRPLPSGKISLRNAIILSYATTIIGVFLSIFLGYIQFLIALITAVLLFYYAKTLKRQGLPGNLIVALTTALSIFYGGVSFFHGNWLERVIIPTAYSFLLTLGREFIKGIEDYEGDKAYNVKTLATTLGIKETWKISRIVLILMLFISPLPLLLGFNILYLVLLIPFFYFTIKAIISETSSKGGGYARSYMKASAFIGMIAFILGSLPINILI